MSKKQKITWLIVGITGSLVCQILFAVYSSDMIARGYDIIDFEFAWTINTMNIIITAWNDILPNIINFMIIDMFFPIFYFMIFSGWTLLITVENKWGALMVQFAFYASIFDYIERSEEHTSELQSH